MSLVCVSLKTGIGIISEPLLNLSNKLAIKKLTISNFRSHSEFSETFDCKINILHGENGVGKTNILEAISLLSPGKGLRSSRFSEMINNTAHDWTIYSEIFANDNVAKVGSNYESRSSVKRQIKIDGSFLTKHTEILNYVRVIWLTPQMDGLFLDSPSVRRKFLDRMVYNFNPEHANLVCRYENLVKSRLKIITQPNFDSVWVNNIEKLITDFAYEIAVSRVNCIRMLSDNLKNFKTAFLIPTLSVKGQIEEMLEQGLSKDEIHTHIKYSFEKNRERDGRFKKTHYGTHISDLKALNPKKDIDAALCSTGEQKAMLVSLILAQTWVLNSQYNIHPIVLLDEVFTHFDNERRTQLANELEGLAGQFFITTTELDLNKLFASSASLVPISNKII